jgi:hypothetical protein
VAELAFGMMIMAVRNFYDGKSGTELMGEKLGTESQLESAGDIFDLNIQVAASGAAEGLDRSFEQGFRDFPVPLRYDDAELHIGCRRQRGVQLRKVVMLG